MNVHSASVRVQALDCFLALGGYNLKLALQITVLADEKRRPESFGPSANHQLKAKLMIIIFVVTAVGLTFF